MTRTHLLETFSVLALSLGGIAACADTDDLDDDVEDGELIDVDDEIDGKADGLTQIRTLSYEGQVSLPAIADLDGDGYTDLASLVLTDQGAYRVEIAWGSAGNRWRTRWRKLLSGIAAPSMTSSGYSLRELGPNTVAIGDWDGDGRLDVATAFGVARARTSKRSFEWRALSVPTEGPYAGPPPVAFLDGQASAGRLLRGTTWGALERCTYPATCTALPGGQPLDPQYDEGIYELVVGDFDRDGAQDLIYGHTEYDRIVTHRRSSRDAFATETPFSAHAVDLRAADIDNDGHLDLVAQKNEYISDFPSDSEVYRNTPAGLSLSQTIYNFDNHTDAAALGDINGDGCVDLIQAGVDQGIGYARGDCTRLTPHDAEARADVPEWATIAGTTSAGVMCRELDANAGCDLVYRPVGAAYALRKLRVRLSPIAAP